MSIKPVKHLAGKLIGLVLVLCCLALGLAGLLIPIIPGLIFLGIAAVIAARHFPVLENVLNRNRHYAECARISDGFSNLNMWDRAQLGFWWSMKLMFNGIKWTADLIKQQTGKLK